MDRSIRWFLYCTLGMTISLLIDYAIKKLNLNVPNYAKFIFTLIVLISVFAIINLIEKNKKDTN